MYSDDAISPYATAKSDGASRTRSKPRSLRAISAPPALEREAGDAEHDEERHRGRTRRHPLPRPPSAREARRRSRRTATENTTHRRRSTASRGPRGGDEHATVGVLEDVVDGLPEDRRLAGRQMRRGDPRTMISALRASASATIAGPAACARSSRVMTRTPYESPIATASSSSPFASPRAPGSDRSEPGRAAPR